MKLTKHFRLYFFSSAVTLFSFFAGDTSAYSENELYNMPLEALLKVTIRCSTLTDETTRTAPSATTLFTQRQIRQLGFDYLHELLNLVPGFQSFRQEESADEYYHSVRGHRSSTSSREVLVLIDGQRFNREFDNALSVPMISLVNVEKIEFIRGPGSAIYGSNAFGGVISITTRESVKEAELQIGQNNHGRLQLLSNYKNNTFQSDVFLNIYNDNEGDVYELQDYATWNFYPVNEVRKGYDVNLKLRTEKLNLDLIHMDRQSEGFYVLETISDENLTHNQISSARLSKDFGGEAFSTTAEVRIFRSFYNTEADDPLLGFTWFQQKDKGLEIKLHNNWSYKENNKIVFGFELRKIEIDEVIYHSSVYGDDLLYDEESRQVFGFYLQSQWDLNESTRFTTGIRLDDYEQAGSSFSPRFGFVHDLTKQQTLKLLYGEAFRAPTTNEMRIRNLYNLLDIAGNPNLKPETVKTWEAIWLGNWKKNSLGVTLFYQVIEDSVFRDSLENINTFRNESGEESSHGLEFEYTIDLSKNIRLRGHYSWFENLSATDYQQADKLAAITLNYHHQQWNYNLSANYAGERAFLAWDRFETIPAYWELNSKLQYQFNDSFSFYLQLKNMLDKDYKTPVRRGDLSIPVPNRGQELSTGIVWKF